VPTRFQARGEAELERCKISTYRTTFALNFSADRMFYLALFKKMYEIQMSNFLTHRVANPPGCIFPIMIISHLLINKNFFIIPES
jgi:hypothetical protein